MPAASARLHVFDAVFTRMGASDNLAMGRSTFLEVLLVFLPGLWCMHTNPASHPACMLHV